MDESWRQIHIGSKLPRRRSTEQKTSGLMRKSSFNHRKSDSETLDPDDFHDVFGGPPRSVFMRQHSGDFASCFYNEIFRTAEFEVPGRNGRNLPAFRIPTSTRGGNGRKDGFYDDIFGSGDDRRSRSRSDSKSKSNSSSVLSSEDLSPLRPSIDEAGFSSFASKLRPIIIPSRQSSTSTLSEEHRKQKYSAAPPNTRPSFMDFQFTEPSSSDLYTKSLFGFSHRMPSPETINLEPSSYRSVKILADDLEVESPSSEISSLGQDLDARGGMQEKDLHGRQEEEAEFLESYVIEISSDRKEESEEAVAVDEAIAWAKEKSQARNLEDCLSRLNAKDTCRINESTTYEAMQGESTDLAQPKACGKKHVHTAEVLEAENEMQQWDKDMEIKLLEEDMKHWSAGKEGNVRALLSTLQYILWPDSGWYAIPLTELIESSGVKKAYQKARLCLHPDKLQQKGATMPQKYIAERVFTLLQDAWASFNSADVFSG